MNSSSYYNGSFSNMSSTAGAAAPPQPPAPVSDKTELYLGLKLKYVVLAIGTAGLILILTILILLACRYKGKWKKHLMLLTNVMLSDILVCVAAIIVSSTSIAKIEIEEKVISTAYTDLEAQQRDIGLHRRFSCANFAGQTLWDISTNASYFALLLLTLDHLIAVRWSIQHATIITNKWVIGSCIVAWLVAVMLGSVSDILIGLTYITRMDDWPVKRTTHACYRHIIYTLGEQTRPKVDEEVFKNSEFGEIKYDQHDDINIAISIATIGITFLFMFGVYTYIATVVVSVNRKRKAQNEKYRETYHNLKGVGTTIMLLVSFIFLNFPQIVTYIMISLGTLKKLGLVWQNIFFIAACASPIVNIIIYAARNKDVRSALCTSPRMRNRAGKMAMSSTHRTSNMTLSTSMSSKYNNRVSMGSTLKVSEDQPLTDTRSSTSSINVVVHDSK